MAFAFQIFLILFFLAFTLLFSKDTKNGIYAVIFLVPAYLIRFSIFGIPTTALEIMIYILFAFWLWNNRGNINVLKGLREFFSDEKLLFWGVALLFLGVILSSVSSSDIRASLGIMKGWFFDPFLFFVVFVNEIKNQKRVSRAIQSFIFSACVVALIAMLYALAGNLTFDGRLGAFYESPNYLAMYLSPAFLFAVYFVKEGAVLLRGARRRGNLSVILLLLIFTILLTKSYGAILGITVASACLLAKSYKERNRKFFVENKKTLLIASAIIVIIFSFLSYQKYEQIMNSNERSSFHSRLMIWEASSEMLKDSPIVGIGPGTFQEIYLEYQSRFDVPYLEWAVAEPHNTFLAFYLQSGIIGLVGFLLILLWLFKRARYDDMIFLFLVYFLAHGLVDTLYWKNDLAVIFWMVVGVCCIITKSRKLDK